MTMKSWLFLTLAALLAPLVNAATALPASAAQAGTVLSMQQTAFKRTALPPATKLIYRVDSNKFPFRMRAELLWQHQEPGYQARLRFSAFGLTRMQTSLGKFDAFGLAPERFTNTFRNEEVASFDRAQGIVRFSANTPSAVLQPGAQDRLSVTLQLAALVASAPQRFAPGTVLNVQTVSHRDADAWRFKFGGMETLQLPGGTLQALKLERMPRKAQDQQLELWLAPELAYLPVRIRLTETNGDYADQKWQATEAADSP
ncbi:MAG: hypothetical protein CO105_12560 [Comamonadaceae bacterium CG_4_9_14_3_um_filter_60_33]|nr:MAG: hypothetical protein COZ09_04605 [Comamonadaceae bacterium CG_4_10_14_3_um_filter_60_42]PJB41843.1 MAG: hypothetical protein CO105_12560 [Comamonadaceae bacterium CG_4_9_14_3_um_filter_60_33]